MAGRFALGVIDLVYAPSRPEEAARLAAGDGFDHVDVMAGLGAPAEAALALPVGDRCAFPSPLPGCSTPAPPAGPGAWERAVAAWRGAPGARLEPWGGSIVGSVAAVRAFVAEVPGLRLLVDTGHVAAWGEDPCELLDLADHVQLRQAAPGRVQVHADDAAGTVDLAAVVGRLDRAGYRGRLTVEYFDLPDLGWPLDDPRGWAVALAARVRPLL